MLRYIKYQYREMGAMWLRCLLLVMLAGLLGLVNPPGLKAAVVGHFTEVEGPVDLFKGGKLPAVPVKVQDGVEQGDVVRTKSTSRAQLKFMDDTTLAIAPSSRVAIEEYMFDAAKGQRRAVLQVFMGLVETTVTKLFETKEPDFIMKTHTAIMGVRGTKWFARLLPQATEVYTENSLLSVQNIFPEIKGEVLLKSLQYTLVGMNQTPTVALDVTRDDLKMIKGLFIIQPGAAGAGMGSQSTPTPAPAGGVGGGQTSVAGLVAAVEQQTTQVSQVQNPTSNLYVPPVANIAQPIPQPPPIVTTFTFTQTFTGDYVLTSSNPTVGLFKSNPQNPGTMTGTGTRTGVYPGNFSAGYAITATYTSGSGFSSYNTGTLTVLNSSGTVSGLPNQTLNGTMTMTAQTSGGTNFNFKGPVTLQPNGNLSFTPNGTFTLGAGNGTTTGTWNQTTKK